MSWAQRVFAGVAYAAFSRCIISPLLFCISIMSCVTLAQPLSFAFDAEAALPFPALMHLVPGRVVKLGVFLRIASGDIARDAEVFGDA
jgi:hypothetical protein